MSKSMLVLLLLVELLSLFLIARMLRSNRGFFEKTALSVMLLVPFVGPLIYFFLIEDLSPQHPFLHNIGARGDFTHRMISIQADLDASCESLSDGMEEENSLHDERTKGSE